MKLLPCPFCGTGAHINKLVRKYSEGYKWEVFCDWGTDHYMTIKTHTRSGAIKAWNTRAKTEGISDKPESAYMQGYNYGRISERKAMKEEDGR